MSDCAEKGFVRKAMHPDASAAKQPTIDMKAKRSGAVRQGRGEIVQNVDTGAAEHLGKKLHQKSLVNPHLSTELSHAVGCSFSPLF
jgi:hypothetical protein